MYKIKGYMFIGNKKLPIETDYIITGWEEGHQFISSIGEKIGQPITNYLFTLIPQKGVK